MAFSQGLFSFCGIPTAVPRTIMELSIVLLFMKSFCEKSINKSSFIVFGLLPMTGFLFVAFLSFYMSNEPVLAFILFCRHVFIFYFFFLALLNLNLPQRTISKFNYYLIFLFLIQIPANLIKFFTIGQKEGLGIGTMSMEAGSLTTMFTLFAIAFSFAFYLFKKHKRYLILIIGFFVFSLIGEKRAVAFYLPVLMLMMYYLYTKHLNYKRKLFFYRSYYVNLFLIIVISTFGIYTASRLILSLNPQRVIGGVFDIQYIGNKIVGYSVLTTESGAQLGRFGATVHSLQFLKKAGPIKVLFGTGAGSLITSQILPERAKKVTDITSKFGIESGITGFVWFFLQSGVLGVMFLLCLYSAIFKKAYKAYKYSSDESYRAIALGFLGVNIVFFLDFFTYSRTSLTSGVLTPVYFYIAFVLFKGYVHRDQSTLRRQSSKCKNNK